MTTHRAQLEVVSTAEKGNQGIVEAVVSTIGNAYQMPDAKHLMLTGAFAKTIARKPTVPAHFGHNGFDGELPIGHATVKETGGRLIAVITYYIDTSEGRRAFLATKAGALTEYSIGYQIVAQKAKGDTLEISECELIEVSVVLKGANPKTSTLSYASAEGQESNMSEIDEIARRTLGYDNLPPQRDLVAELDRRERIRREFAQANSGPVTADRNVAAEMAEHARSTGEGQGAWSYTAEDAAAVIHGAASHPLNGHPEFLSRPAIEPAPQGVLSVVPVTPHGEGNVKLVTELERTGSSAATPYGSNLPELVLDLSAATGHLERFGNFIEEATYVLDDAGQGAETLLRITTSDLRRSLARDVVVGDGVDGTPLGLRTQLDALGGTFVIDGTGATIEALAEAAGAVGDSGFADYSLVAIVHPSTLTSVVFGDGTSDPRAALPTIGRFIASPALAPGEAVVGEFSDSCEIFVHDLEILMTLSNEANFTKRIATISTTLRQLFHTRHITAFRLVTNLGAV